MAPKLKKYVKTYRRKYVNGVCKPVHRVIMEKHLGRKLRADEFVHHIDGNINNNSIENLEAMPARKHPSIHHLGRKRPKKTVERLRKALRIALPMAKLSPEDIPTIRKMIRDKIRYWLIAWIYQVNVSAISRIKTGKRWSWVK